MMTVGPAWEIGVVVVPLFLGLALWLITRPVSALSIPVRCPIRGNNIAVVQHVPEEGSYVTDVVSCGAFPDGRRVTCGLPCLTSHCNVGATPVGISLRD